MRWTLTCCALLAMLGQSASAKPLVSAEARQRMFVIKRGSHLLFIDKPSNGFSTMFYGNKKRANLVRIQGASGRQAKGEYRWYFVSKRPYDTKARLESHDGYKRWLLHCEDVAHELELVTGLEREKLLEEVDFVEERLPYSPLALARDALGTYYLVDTDVRSSFVFRLYVGQAGKLRRLRLEDAVSDSAGEILFSRKGKLRLDRDKARGPIFVHGRHPLPVKATWITKRDRIDLTVLSVLENGSLIYNELGVYDKWHTGSPCEDVPRNKKLTKP